MEKLNYTCEDSDPQCPHCHGHCHNWASTVLYRIDMEDHTGTAMCGPCTDDAMESGLFKDKF